MVGKKQFQNNETVLTTDVQGKYLTFKLNSEEYGLEVLRVKEIIGIMKITTIPQTPSYVKGVINLRGKVIPVIDLRLKLGMNETDYNRNTCIIVVDINENGSNVHVGFIVDSVSEVINIVREDYEPAPKFGFNINSDFIIGMVKSQDKVRTLLNIEKILKDDSISTMIETVA